jgi:hypothetical protein
LVLWSAGCGRALTCKIWWNNSTWWIASPSKDDDKGDSADDDDDDDEDDDDDDDDEASNNDEDESKDETNYDNYGSRWAPFELSEYHSPVATFFAGTRQAPHDPGILRELKHLGTALHTHKANRKRKISSDPLSLSAI